MGLAEFSQIILHRRKDMKLTQDQVARRVGVHANYVGYLERGLRRPGDRTLIALCDALELDKATLFATLNPLFRDIVKTTGDLPEEAGPTPIPLQELLDDAGALKKLGANADDIAKLRVLSVFGDVRNKEDYIRAYQCIQDITE